MRTLQRSEWACAVVLSSCAATGAFDSGSQLVDVLLGGSSP